MAWSEPRSYPDLQPTNQLSHVEKQPDGALALLRVETTAQSADMPPVSPQAANGTHPTSTPEQSVLHGLPLRTCGLKYQQHLRAPAGLRVPRGSAPITSSGAHSTVPHGSPHRHAQSPAGQDGPGSTRRVRRCSHSHSSLSAWPSCLPHGRSYPPAPKHTCPEVSLPSSRPQ